MSDDTPKSDGAKPGAKSRTLADFIPDEPKPAPKADRRRKPTRAEADRLEALERAVRDTEPDAVRRRTKKSRDRSVDDLKDYYENKGWKTKKRKGKGGGKFIFWAVLILLLLVFVFD